MTSGWVAFLLGSPLPFEEMATYRARIKRERFDLDMLNRYCEALGIARSNDRFYGQHAVLHDSPPSRGARDSANSPPRFPQLRTVSHARSLKVVHHRLHRGARCVRDMHRMACQSGGCRPAPKVLGAVVREPKARSVERDTVGLEIHPRPREEAIRIRSVVE